MSENRRAHPRAPIDVLFNAITDGLGAVCAAVDVSEGGIGLRRLQDVTRARRAAVHVELQLPGSERVITAVGRYRSDAGASAIVFDTLAPEHRNEIRAFVSAAA